MYLSLSLHRIGLSYVRCTILAVCAKSAAKRQPTRHTWSICGKVGRWGSFLWLIYARYSHNCLTNSDQIRHVKTRGRVRGHLHSKHNGQAPVFWNILGLLYMSTCYGTEYKALHGMAPDYLRELCRSVSEDDARGSLRSAERGDLVVLRERRQKFGDRAFAISGPLMWNSLPTTVRNSSTLSNFKSALKSHLFTWLYSRGCINSYDLWRRPWIGFTCYGAIEIIDVFFLLLLLLLLLKQPNFAWWSN